MVAQDELLTIMYNLILNPATRDWEREQLATAKNTIGAGASFSAALATLEGKLRPLALRNNLTPDVADFYALVVGDVAEADTFDLSRHFNPDAPYEDRAILPEVVSGAWSNRLNNGPVFRLFSPVTRAGQSIIPRMIKF